MGVRSDPSDLNLVCLLFTALSGHNLVVCPLSKGLAISLDGGREGAFRIQLVGEAFVVVTDMYEHGPDI